MEERMTQASSPQSYQFVWSCRLFASLLILLSAGLHFTYLAIDCPLDLAPDEAHYWDWSRHLDWSYYSKGPLVAYLIRGGCELVEPWTGPAGLSPAIAVRLPAVLCGSLLLVSLYILTVQVYRREGLALGVVAAALTLPVMSAGSSLMTIDSPYTCCWGWALVLGHSAVIGGRSWAWPATGLMIGLGILAKYNMGLWVVSLGLFLLFSREYRQLLWRPGFWVMTSIAGLCCLPIVLWNWQHDWVTVRHVEGLAGLRDGPRWHWNGPLVYVATQCGLFLVFWFVAWAASMVAHRPWKEPDAGLQYLWWLSAPMFAVFLLFSFKTGGGEPNWPITAYVSGLVLAAGWLSQQLQANTGWYRRLAWANLAATCLLGLVVSVFMHHSDWLYPALAKVAPLPTEKNPFPLRRFDPTCRLRGWHTLTAEVDHLRDRLHAEGNDAVLAGAGWALPGELGFYCAGHPTVYSIGPAMGDRRSQYDFWRPNPIGDPDRFIGQTFIMVGNDNPSTLQPAFAWVEPPIRVTYYEHGQPIAAWTVIVAHGFRGFPRGAGSKSY
jgi:4-amino-4-deoxy-L-arabinose transferase-like glycosyltransferase